MSESPFAPFETGAAFDALRDLIRSVHPPLALVGSGASVNSDYPSWPELMGELRSMAGPEAQIPQRQEALKGDAAWEAEVHFQAIGERKFQNYIRRRFGPPAAVAEPHPTIAAMPFRHFLTTNYDPCIELALQVQGEAPTCVAWEDGEALSRFLINLSGPSEQRSVVYLHGRFDVPRHAVLTESAYVDRYIRSDDARRKLLAIFMTHPVVFVGFSMTDPDFGNLMREVTARLRTRPPSHYALVGYGTEPEREVYRERMRGKFGVEPIFYSYAKDGDDRHAHLLQLLEALAPPAIEARKIEASAVPKKEKMKTLGAPPRRDPNDPEKHQWGGVAEIPGRRLSVKERAGGYKDQVLAFDLIVESLPGLPPIEGDVTFHLHPTFDEPVQVVRAEGGKAVLDECKAYGAFTVGVSADSGRTRLELDLAMQKDLPEWFRLR